MAQILKFKGDYNGLDTEKAENYLQYYGYNTDVKQEKKPKINLYGVFKSIKPYLMLGAAFLYFLGGKPVSGGLLILLTLLYCTVEIMKGRFADEKLKNLTRATDITVRVVRDGGIVLIKRENIAQDDLIILQGGENVPADAFVLEVHDAYVDESAFTKVNTPIKKIPGTDDKNELKRCCIYKGTKVTSGILIARVFATGQDTKIRPKIRSAKELYTTGFEAAINKFSHYSTYVALVLLIIALAFKFISASGLSADDVASESLLVYFTMTILPAVSFAICILPAEAASLVRIYYTWGAIELSKRYGEIKHLKAIETLNSVTAVCVGKESVSSNDSTPVVGEYSGNKSMLTRIAALSCKPTPADAYEKAIFVSAAFKHIDTKELHESELIKSYTADEEANYHKMNGCLWDVNGAKLLCVKGEPEVVLSFCKPPSEQLFAIQKKRQEYSKEGYQVFAIAFAQIDEDENGKVAVPKTLFEPEYTFLGLIAFSGNIKESIPNAVRNCYRAGVKVILITHDSKETALAVAEKIGLKSGGIITGEELERVRFDGDKMDVSGVNVFAGIAQGQKGDIIRLLREAGEIVAAFGSDSTDTEALELADVGIALSKYTTEREWDMNIDTLSQSTTGSACEACDFIMEGDGFVKAADTFREARQMHRNIKRCISAAVSALAVIAPFAIINLLIGKAFVPEAALVSLLTVVVIPLIMVMFRENKADLKTALRPSGFLGKGVVNRNFFIGAGIQGGALLLVQILMFFIMPYEVIEQQRAVFTAIFFSGIISMAWVGLSFEKPFYRFFNARNKFVIYISGGLLLFLPLIVYIPGMNTAFGLAAINPLILILCLIIGAASQLWYDFVKKRFSH
ncbi:MAG: cation-translocating P-type ATPase [Oscillospiraceae bacterium]|nr:cation-translocating P-type ATPase [Oscillospiraceae bacterium]